MAFVHGKSTKFSIQDAANTLRDISAFVSSVDMPISAETAETTTFGSASKSYVAGVKDGTLSIEGKWDPVVDAYLYGILGMERDFEYGPAGGANGAVKYSGKAICTNYTPPSDIGDAVGFSAEFQISGNVTRGIY